VAKMPFKKYKKLKGERVMREKNFNERVKELKEKYEGVNDFDFETIIQLEDEYHRLLKNNPEHTKRRSEILTMRRDLSSRLKIKPEERNDMYIEPDRDRITIYYNGKISYIREPTYKDAVNRLYELIDTTKFNIYVNTIGVGQGFADELENRNIEYKELKRYLATK
jgi:glutamate mutase epsilon subunit